MSPIYRKKLTQVITGMKPHWKATELIHHGVTLRQLTQGICLEHRFWEIIHEAEILRRMDEIISTIDPNILREMYRKASIEQPNKNQHQNQHQNQMNVTPTRSQMLALANDNLKTVNVVFSDPEQFGFELNEERQYTYFVHTGQIELPEVGTQVIVETGDEKELKFAWVVKIHEVPEVPTGFEIKWVLGVPTKCLELQKSLHEYEEKASQVLLAAKRRAQQEQLKAEVADLLGEETWGEIKQLETTQTLNVEVEDGE